MIRDISLWPATVIALCALTPASLVAQHSETAIAFTGVTVITIEDSLPRELVSHVDVCIENVLVGERLRRDATVREERHAPGA